VIRVAVSTDPDTGTATIDFAGTSPQLASNFNAPTSVVRAACPYAVRTLFDLPMPLNDGFLRPIAIRIPEGALLAPRWPAAVVAGNVETSQLITDALMLPLGAMAASGGTMNNYPAVVTSAGIITRPLLAAPGAVPAFRGADAGQTHITRSHLTDPEVLEQRFLGGVRALRRARRLGWRGAPGGGGYGTRPPA
jgi:5-oxoprolinase (ATP-hydrolysing)